MVRIPRKLKEPELTRDTGRNMCVWSPAMCMALRRCQLARPGSDNKYSRRSYEGPGDCKELASTKVDVGYMG